MWVYGGFYIGINSMSTYEHKARQLLLRMDCFKFSDYNQQFIDAMSMSASDVCELANLLQEVDTLRNKQGGTPNAKVTNLQNALWEGSKIMDELLSKLLPNMDVAETQTVIHRILAWKEGIHNG